MHWYVPVQQFYLLTLKKHIQNSLLLPRNVRLIKFTNKMQIILEIIIPLLLNGDRKAYFFHLKNQTFFKVLRVT